MVRKVVVVIVMLAIVMVGVVMRRCSVGQGG